MRFGPPPGRVSRPFWLLAFLIGSGTIGMHVFAPVLPLIAAEFRIGAAATQLTISVYMFALAAGQLVYGPLSDRFGRRPVLFAGLGIFVLSGILAALAPTFETLLAARVLQASGGCAGLVIGRAIVSDTSVREADAAATIGGLNAILLVSPALAPMLGLWIADIYGWRSIPLLLSVLGCASLFGAVFLLSETSQYVAEPVRLIVSKYGRLVRRPMFVANVVAGGLATTTMFVVLTTSPFVVTQTLHRPLAETGYFYAVFVCGVMVGSLLAARLVNRIGFDRLIVCAVLAGTTGSILFVLCIETGRLTATTFIVSGVLYTFMSGLLSPVILTRSIGMAPDLKGSASGIFGFWQMMMGAGAVSITVSATDIASTAAFVMLGSSCTALAIFVAIAIVRRHEAR